MRNRSFLATFFTFSPSNSSLSFPRNYYVRGVNFSSSTLFSSKGKRLYRDVLLARASTSYMCILCSNTNPKPLGPNLSFLCPKNIFIIRIKRRNFSTFILYSAMSISIFYQKEVRISRICIVNCFELEFCTICLECR